MDILLKDLRYGIRVLRSRPAFTLIAVVALALNRVMASLLFEIDSTDPATCAGLSPPLFLIAAVACLVPALRAARVDPVPALRHE